MARGVLSAPVWDPDTKHYVGFLDVKDLVSFVVFHEEEKEREESRRKNSAKDLLQLPSADYRQFMDVAARMYKEPAAGINITYLARRHQFRAVHADSPLAEVLHVLGTAGVHRVPVTDRATGKVVDIVSQSTFIQFVEKHKAACADLLEATVEGTGIGSRPVVPVSSTDSALRTFQVMSKHNRSGVAVCDAESGRFLVNTSSSDLKLLLADLERTHALLDGSVLDFLSAVRQSEVSDTRFPTIAVSRRDKIGAIIGKLAATRIHRVFVADDDHGFKPEAVVSITDVLRHLSTAGITASSSEPTVTVTAE